jgi:hypothetical protein
MEPKGPAIEQVADDYGVSVIFCDSEADYEVALIDRQGEQGNGK